MSPLTGGAYNPPGQTPHGNARAEGAVRVEAPASSAPSEPRLYLDDGDVQLCACGCGEPTPRTDSRGRPKRYAARGHNLRAIDNHMVNGGHNPFAGRTHSLETRRVLSAKASVPKPWLRGTRNGMSGRTGPLNPNYKDGSTPERQRLYASGEGRALIRAAYERDGYRCTNCGAPKSGPRSLHAHHVKSWGEYPELRFDIDNLVTLCRDCHHDAHRKGVTP